MTMRQCDIVPAILTCGRNSGVTAQFVSSLKSVRHGLGEPIAILDLSAAPMISGEYLSLLAAMEPRAVCIHPREPGMDTYNSVQLAARFALETALAETADGESVLFMEDDIVFAGPFLHRLRELSVPSDAGFVSLYAPGDGYGTANATRPEGSPTAIDPNRFYGTQCVLFPRNALAEIVGHYDDMQARIPPGYDIRWSRFLAERGFQLYCTDPSYVQHIGGPSRLHGTESHVSHRFRN